MLYNATLPEVKNPERMKTESMFSSHSFSACVASVLEVDSTPLFELEGLNWMKAANHWAMQTHRCQMLLITLNVDVAGLHLKFFGSEHDRVILNDRSIIRMEAFVYFNNELMYNPSGVNVGDMIVTNHNAIFIPFDPLQGNVKYQH